jgi:small conductance mechanosensitive channel
MSDASTQEMIQAGMELLVAYGLRVVGAIVLLLVGRMVAGALRKGVRSAMTRRKVDETLIPFASGIVYYLALAVVLIAVLGLFGIETTSLIAVLGAAGLAVGLALQGTLSNFAAGVMILIFRPFKLGDFVETAGSTGSVKEIGIFTTTLATPDNKKVIVPNSAAFGGTITNYSAYGTRRNDMVIGISYDDDIGRAVEIIRGILASDERVLKDPESVVAVGGLGDSSVDLIVRPWCNASDYWGVRSDVTRRMKEELEAAGCSIPYPQRDLHVLPPPA